MTDLPASLRALQVYAETLPAGTVVPVARETLLELLARQGGAGQTSATPPADLTVADVCARFGRKPSAVRNWLERGMFPGAYRLMGRAWRVPVSAVEAFQVKQAGGAGESAPTPGDLGAWRRLR